MDIKLIPNFNSQVPNWADSISSNKVRVVIGINGDNYPECLVHGL